MTALHPPGSRLDGAGLFIRYAYPPNAHGSCGPDDHLTLFEYGVARTIDPGLVELTSQFTGAWPYLSFIAEVTRIGDPLDHRVVEAYWVGNDLLERIDLHDFGRSMEDRFRRRSGPEWVNLAQGIPAGGLPHHAFHVFGVYPWVDLLAADRGPHPLHILDRCRIRWGEVVAVSDDFAVVDSRPLLWDGRHLSLGAPVAESVRIGLDGKTLLPRLDPGDVVALHWDWVCDKLTPRQLGYLTRFTERQLTITNDRVGPPGRIVG